MYNYEAEKKKIFTDEGQKLFLSIRDKAQRLLKEAGAFRRSEVTSGHSGDSWTMMACVDRMVELGEIVQLPRNCWGQFDVFTTPEVSNR